MDWSMLPYTMVPFRIPPPLMLHTPPPHDDELPMDLSIAGKNRLPATPPPTPDTPISCSSGCQSPRFESLVGMSQFSVVPSKENERTYDCADCKYTTRRRTNLKRHIQSMHSRQEIVECCGEHFYSKAEFRAHVKQSHQTGYKCQLCDRSFCRKALLKRHMSVHNGIKEFNCSLCQYATSHKSNLERHQRVHNRQNNVLFNNDDAATKFKFPPMSSSAQSPSHMSTTSDSVADDSNTEVSVEEIHAASAAESVISPDETSEACREEEKDVDKPMKDEPDTCNDRMIALRVATEEVLAMQETSKMMAGCQRLYTWPYKCVQCVQKFKTQQALTLHEIQVHPNRRADAFLSFPLKYQLKVVYNAISQARESSKQD